MEDVTGQLELQSEVEQLVCSLVRLVGTENTVLERLRFRGF